MKSYDLVALTKKIHDSQLQFFTLQTLEVLLQITPERSLFRVIHRLLHANVLVRVEKNKYIRSDSRMSEFSVANFLYQPSYVSFESALSFYGVLSQFPTQVTSATNKLTRLKKWENKEFSYVQIQPNLYWGYKKLDNYLIAETEKALLDQIYIATKGSKSLDFDEYDLSHINKSLVQQYSRLFPQTRQFLSGMKQFKEFL